MSYIEKNLGASEKLIRRAAFHWFYYLRAWLVLFLFLVFAILVEKYSPQTWPMWPAITIAVLGLLFYLRLMIPIWTTEIGVTNQRLIYKRGLFSRHTDEVELWAVEAINLRQGLLGRLLGYGHFTVQGIGKDRLPIPLIQDPFEFRRAVQDAISRVRPPAGAARAQPQTSAARAK